MVAVQSAPAEDEAADSPLQTEIQKASYALGMDFAGGLKTQNINIDPELFSRAVRDVYAEEEPLMTKEQAREVLIAFQRDLQEKIAQRNEEKGEKNLAAGKAYLDENKEKEGVVVLPSGLQYEVVTEGDGEKPAATDTVVVHYTGSLIDGTVFDSSVERGEPATFPVNRVIPGWTEALQLMPVGSKWKLTIPADLAYGTRGAPPRIAPNATLLFDVELLEIK
jgi:FKBP-type peptidyl-prolyl cis-trans isomerase FklB